MIPKKVDERMNEWMDGWMDGWMDEWMNKPVGEWMDGCGWMDTRTRQPGGCKMGEKNFLLQFRPVFAVPVAELHNRHMIRTA
jgi:hypothetical protein